MAAETGEIPDRGDPRCENTRYRPYNRGNESSRGRYNGVKRKSDDTRNHGDSKAPRIENSNFRGTRRNWRGPGRGGEKSKVTETAADYSEYSVIAPINVELYDATDTLNLKPTGNTNILLSKFLVDTGRPNI